MVRRDVAASADVVCNHRMVPEWEVEPGMDVILTIVKAELTANPTVLGYMQSYVNVRCGPAPGLMWTVNRSPTTWSSAAAPEWQHACPAQPRAALLGAGVCAELCIEVVQDAVLGLGEAEALADTGSLPASQLLLPGENGESFACPAKHDSGLHELPLWRAEENVGTVTVHLSLQPEAPRLQPRSPAHHPGHGLSPAAYLRKARKSVRRVNTPSPSSSSSSDLSDSELSPVQQLSQFVEKLRMSPNSSANSSPQVRRGLGQQPAIAVRGPGTPELAHNGGKLSFGRLRCSQAKHELAMTAHPSAGSSALSDSEAETMVSMSPAPSLELPQKCHRAQQLGNNGGRAQGPAMAFGHHQTFDKMQKNGFSNTAHFDSPHEQDLHQGRGLLVAAQPLRKEATALSLQKEGSRREDGGKDIAASPCRAPGAADASAVKKVMKRLQTQARKYPRNDSGWFSQSKERFFAITGERGTEATSGAGDGRGAISARSLALSWFDDKAAWKSHSRPCGSIQVACIRGAALTDPSTQGTEVTLRFADVAEDPGQPSRVRLVFESKAAASEWSKCLNDLLDLLREP